MEPQVPELLAMGGSNRRGIVLRREPSVKLVPALVAAALNTYLPKSWNTSLWSALRHATRPTTPQRESRGRALSRAFKTGAAIARYLSQT